MLIPLPPHVKEGGRKGLITIICGTSILDTLGQITDYRVTSFRKRSPMLNWDPSVLNDRDVLISGGKFQ